MSLSHDRVVEESDALHARAQAIVRAFEQGATMPETFDSLAVDLARFQAARVPGYDRLCAARGVDVRAITRASQAPAVPAEAFKLARVFAFDGSDAEVTFRTSGTTVGARGAHAMRTTRSYDTAALAFGRRMLAGDLSGRVPVAIIGPSSFEAPDSSLAHMCDLFVRALGRPEDERAAFVRGGELDLARLRDWTSALPADAPAIILSTSFALVHLIDALAPISGDAGFLPLPPRSRVMLTGGFKGRTREVSARELRRQVARVFRVEERAIIGEYGMTELSSQFWQDGLIAPVAGTRPGDRPGGAVYVEPPWARVIPVDPESLESVPHGVVGIARIEDLANIDSAFAVLAHDRVRRVHGGFELLGRAAGAPPRGCSIAVDEMLSSCERALG